MRLCAAALQWHGQGVEGGGMEGDAQAPGGRVDCCVMHTYDRCLVQTYGARFSLHGGEDEESVVDEFTDAEKVPLQWAV